MNVDVARAESGTQSPIGRAPHQSIAADFSPRWCCGARSAARSCRRRHGWRSIPIGVRTPSAPIAWRGRWRSKQRRTRRLDVAASPRSARAGCRRRSGRRPAPYRGTRATRAVPAPAASAVSRCIRFGWHVDLWGGGPNKNANWHCACVIAWQFWNAPSEQARLLRRVQARRCGQGGGRLWKIRRGRPPRAAVPGVERASRYAVAGAARLFGACRTCK